MRTGMERGKRKTGYDVFLSHSSLQKSWVEALARNLREAGKRVFLDVWELVPGRSWVAGLEAGLKASRSAVLVASPEAYNSGWVQREYETMLARSVRDPSFVIIPVVHGAVEAEFPFAGTIQWVDFRPPRCYRESFARLLCGLEGRPPGERPTYAGPLEEPDETAAPAAPAAGPAEAVLRALDSAQLVLLMIRDGHRLGRIVQTLTAAAERRFPPDRIRRLFLPYVPPEGSPALHYRALAAQAGLAEGIVTPGDFHAAALQKLAAGRWLWVISGFEHGAPPQQEDLARGLRTWMERNPEFRVVVCGGERVDELKHGEGAHSVFSNGAPVFWPDLTEGDLRDLVPAGCTVDDAALARVMAIAGGHPALAGDLLAAGAHQGDWSREALEEAALGSRTVWAALLPLVRTGRTGLAALADRDDLGYAAPYLFDPVLRRLYWCNLIAERRVDGRRRLVWRSESIRRTVRLVLDQAKPVPDQAKPVP